MIRFLVVASVCTHFAVAQTASPAPRPVTPDDSGRPNLERHLDSIASGYLSRRAGEIASIQNRADAENRQAKVRTLIQSLIGTLPEKSELNVRVLGITETDGFRIEKVIFDSQPGFHVTALLYVPSDIPKGNPAGGRFPAIVMAPGHAASGKASDFATAAIFARNGFVVLSYDPIGQGERLQYPDPAHPGTSLATRPTGEHGEAGLQPTLIGDTMDRYLLWDSMRAVDYLAQRPEVDPKRIGAFGCSGGGAITAMAGALDPRIAAIGVACYTTSFETMLESIGPQDAEQSIPHFIASGLDFPDWIELAAPRPYVVIATYSDMFPFAGARATVSEARRFYSFFDPASAGSPLAPTSKTVPTGPALNSDTTNTISPAARLQFTTGPGGHGALRPIIGDIVSFFIRNLQPGSDVSHPYLPPAQPVGSVDSILPKGALQVTPTGQVATSYPDSQTVFTLNQRRAVSLIPHDRPVLSGIDLTAAIRSTTGSATRPGALKPDAHLLTAGTGAFVLPSSAGLDLHGDLFVPISPGTHPAVILLVPDSIHADTPISRTNKAQFDRFAAAGNVVLAITPRPSPPGKEEMKSPILGSFYLLGLRAELVSRTIVSMRIDDVIRITDYIAGRPDVDRSRIIAFASSHMGLVLLHAAVIDARLQHITVDHVLRSYRGLLDAALPVGAPEDIVPGVLLHYDIPDLIHALGDRLTESDSLPGSSDLSQTSTLQKP